LPIEIEKAELDINMKNTNNMTESEQFIADQRIAEKALNNAYDLVIGKITLEELFIEAELKPEGSEVYLPFDPHHGIPEDCIDILLDHFIYTEEYEKCAELVKIKKKSEKS
jgi:hypothetical protein